jgi:NAD(P)-dependent dehydrogenase (short-subunit alcohol dehydrogenase family)
LLRGIDAQLVRGSRVVVITGFLGLEPTAHEAAPGAINAAVHNLVRQTAELYGPRGTTVHAICPGPVDTQRLRNIGARVAEERGLTLDEVMAEYKATSSLNELITTDQVAWAASILLDDEASALHGATLSITGGRLKGIW